MSNLNKSNVAPAANDTPLPVENAPGVEANQSTDNVDFGAQEAWKREQHHNGRRWNDATIIGDLEAPEAKALLKSDISVMFAYSQRTPGPKWLKQDGTVEQLLNTTLTKHPSFAEKDGEAFVYATSKLGAKITDADGKTIQRTYRVADMVKSINAIAIDVDGTDKVERIKDRVEELGLFAVIYTTHSYVEKWSEDGERFRVILFLDQPFAIPVPDKGTETREARKQRRDAVYAYQARYAGVCELLGLIDVDSSALNVHQMMFTPRRPSEDSAFKHYVIAGKALDLGTVTPGDPTKYRKGGEYTGSGGTTAKAVDGPAVLSDGFDLREWWDDGGSYLPVELLLDYLGWEERGPGGDGVNILCPNDANHSDAGNPDDKGCWALQRDDDFVIKCRHDHCLHLHTWDHIRLIEASILEGHAHLPDEYDTLSDLLCDGDLYPIVNGVEFAFDRDHYIGREAPKTAKTADEIAGDIGQFDADTTEETVYEYLSDLISENADTTTINKARDALVKSDVPLGKADLNAMVKKARQEADDAKTDAINAKLEREHEARQKAPTPDYVPVEDATPESVLRAASASKWLPHGYTYNQGWYGTSGIDATTGQSTFTPLCTAFEVVFCADGQKGSTRTNEVTIRYQHRTKSIGVVESVFRLGDTRHDAGALTGRLTNEGLDFSADERATPAILTLLRAIKSERDAVYVAQSGWNEDRTAFVSPTGEVVTDGKLLHVLDNQMRVSKAKAGSLEDCVKATSGALSGKNAKYFLPGFLMGGVGCLADFLDTEMAVILANEGKAKHGKSTALKAGISWFCAPTADGLLITGDVTPTAMEAMAVKSTGVCFAPDEQGTSSNTAADEQRAMLQFAGRIGRARGTTTGGMRDMNAWNGCMGVSTEQGILGRLEAEAGRDTTVDIKAGALSRIFTVNFDSAASLDPIADKAELDAYKVLAHKGAYGWFGPAFARELLKLGVDEVAGRVSALEAEWGKKYSGAASRVVTTAALFGVTAKIMQDAGYLPADVPLQDTLFGLMKETIEARSHHLNTTTQALDTFRRKLIAAEEEHHILGVGEDGHGQSILGRWKDESAEGVMSTLQDRVYIIPVHSLGQFVKTDATALIADLHEEGAIVEPSPGSKYAARRVWESMPGQGRVKNIRVTGLWVHGETDPKDE